MVSEVSLSPHYMEHSIYADTTTGGAVMPMNMGYCRFANTLIALQECFDALHRNKNASDQNDAFTDLSEEEVHAAKQLLLLARLRLTSRFRVHQVN
jgi:hypothetical protein